MYAGPSAFSPLESQRTMEPKSPSNLACYSPKKEIGSIHLLATMTMTKYKAVLFDLDGTLLDTLEDIADAANRVLAARGFPTCPLDIHRAAVGNGARRLMARILPEDQRSEEMIQECFLAFRKDYGVNWNVKTRPYPGIPEMLDALGARGLKLAVLSNKPADFTRKCVYGILTKWKFEEVVGAEDAIPIKPDPTGAVQIAERMRIAPSEFLFLGDTGVDMKAANAAGMFAVGALWGFRDREELIRDGGKVLLEHPTELVDLLN
jgi:phosphoglycolate phosphatase